MVEILLSTPPAFLALPSEPPEPWNRWILSVQAYLLALSLEDVSDAGKRALLLHCLGTEEQRVFCTFGPADTYNEAVAALKAHFRQRSQ